MLLIRDSRGQSTAQSCLVASGAATCPCQRADPAPRISTSLLSQETHPSQGFLCVIFPTETAQLC